MHLGPGEMKSVRLCSLQTQEHNGALFPAAPALFVLQFAWLQGTKGCKAPAICTPIPKLKQCKHCSWQEQSDLISPSAAFGANTTSARVGAAAAPCPEIISAVAVSPSLQVTPQPFSAGVFRVFLWDGFDAPGQTDRECWHKGEIPVSSRGWDQHHCAAKILRRTKPRGFSCAAREKWELLWGH